jgi:hypothetical protein
VDVRFSLEAGEDELNSDDDEEVDDSVGMRSGSEGRDDRLRAVRSLMRGDGGTGMGTGRRARARRMRATP